MDNETSQTLDKYVQDKYKYGFVTNIGDYNRLAQNLEKYINNQNLRKLHGLRSRDIAINNLDIKICADKHLKAYAEVTKLEL